MKLQRMLSILLLIEANGKVKAKDLAEKLETSIRTIYRDIDSICEAGIPLTTGTGPNGGISFMEGYKLDVKNMQIDEITNLYLAEMGINAHKESNMNMNVNMALLKIQNNLAPTMNAKLTKFTKKFFVDDNPWWGEKSTFNCIDTLMEALWENKKLEINYKKVDGYTSNRRIRPYGIVVKQNDWYLIAYCESSDDVRTFKCDRIVECDFLNELFTIPDEFILEDFWHESNSRFIRECEEKEKYPVKIRLDKKWLEKLNDYQIYSINENEKYIEAVVNMYTYELAEDVVIESIGYLEILEPAALREFAINKLAEIQKNYSRNNI